MRHFGIKLIEIALAFGLFGLMFFLLSAISSEWSFFSVLIALPLFLLLYSIRPILRRSGRETFDRDLVYQFCYGGMTFPFVVASTLGSVITVSSVVNATLASMYFIGNAAFVGWLTAIPLFTTLLFCLMTSNAVRTYFSDTSDARGRMRTVVGYISDHYGKRTIGLVSAALILPVVGLAFTEMSFVLLWSERLFGTRFPHPWLIALFWVTIVLIYVFLGGYEQVLRTDFVQFFIVTFSIALIVVVVLSVFGFDLTFRTTWEAAVGGFMDDQRLAENNARHATETRPTLAAMNFFGGFASFILMGLWFVAMPDTWNRLTQYFYVQGDLRRRETMAASTGEGTQRRMLLLFGAVACCLSLGDLPAGFLAAYTFRNQEVVGLSGVPYSMPFDAISFVIRQLTLCNSTGACALPLFSGNLGTLFLLLFLLLILTLAMTTLNTMIITSVQLVADARQGQRVVQRNVLAMQSSAVISFLAFVTPAFGLYGLLDFAVYHRIVITVGLVLCGTSLIMVTFMLVLRTWLPAFLKGDESGYQRVFCIAYVAAKALWGAGIVSKLSWGWLNFEPGVGLILSSIFVIEISTYTIVLVLAYICRRAVLSPSSCGSGNGNA